MEESSRLNSKVGPPRSVPARPKAVAVTTLVSGHLGLRVGGGESSPNILVGLGRSSPPKRILPVIQTQGCTPVADLPHSSLSHKNVL